MNWRIDWFLLAVGLIAIGLTLIQRSRADLLSLLSDDGQKAEGFLSGVGGMLVPILFLGAFVLRLGWRVITRTKR